MTLPLVLGTAQLGMKYGIVNQEDLVSADEAMRIFEYCSTNGIHYIDTSFAYGMSLERIKAYMEKYKKTDLNIINKFSIDDDYEILYKKLSDYLESTGLNSFYALLIHDSAKFSQTHCHGLLPFLQKIKERGIAQKIGISVYGLEELRNCLDFLPVEIIQCPINPLNQTFLQEEFQEISRKYKLEVHARSLFLQGTLLSDFLPPALEKMKLPWQAYRDKIKKLNISSLDALLKWAKGCSFINKWVVGAATLIEIQEIIDAYKNSNDDIPPLDLQELDASNNPYIDPRNWTNQ
jgi:aryl-alcohol dehydrogenase-like predicted oxidoreductase